LKLGVIVEPDFSQCIIGFNQILTSSVRYEGPPPSFARYLLSFSAIAKRSFLKQSYLMRTPAITSFALWLAWWIAIWLLPLIDGYRDIPLIVRYETYHAPYFQYLPAKYRFSKTFGGSVQREGGIHRGKRNSI
jgi:hypothetical protein